MDANQRRRELVRKGYDAISHAYRGDDSRSNPATAESTARYQGWVDELATMLDPGSRVLDLGCGCGLPATSQLTAAGFAVTGLDFSRVQIDRARSLVPAANFIEADMVTWDTKAGSFDAVVSLYALIHIPLADQRPLLSRIARWLRFGGVLLAIVGHGAWSGTEDYLGAPMFWDHADTETYLGWLTESGFRPQWQRFVREGDGGHALVLARVV